MKVKKIVISMSCVLLIAGAISSCADEKKPKFDIEKVDLTGLDVGDENESENESETTSGYDESSYDGSSYDGYTPSPTSMSTPDQMEPRRDQCRACNGTGSCPVCNGNGQTHTKRIYNYDLGCYDLDWEPCNACGASGRHDACGGDGWLDEGVDF